MLDNEVVGIVKLRGGIAVWKNRALERMFGYEPDELLHQHSRLLFRDEASYASEGRTAAHALATTGHHRAQLQMRRKDGHLIWADISGTLLSPETGEAMWVVADITQLKEYQLQVEHIAFHDALTGLPNRLLLADRLHQAIALAARLNQVTTVCFLDLDGFKSVNDAGGHEAGDEVLVQVARRMAACVRGSDTVARLGGDEFIVLLTPMEDEAECSGVLARIIAAVNRPVALAKGGTAQVSASVGVAHFPRHGTHSGELLSRADAALYQSKHAGKNRFTVAA
jgi:diguanylate cyclase (GGDEF)-like protein/PAS domain S-box-containing protein